MPSRRSHTKSHHGCLQCKQRRVKCDETTPQCQRCFRRQMPCSFMDHAPPSSYPTPGANGQAEATHGTLSATSGNQLQNGANASTPTSMVDQSASPNSPPATLSTKSFNRLELELIHHYSTKTYMTLTSKLTAHLVWRDNIFEEALKHDFLLNALLATAALHKAMGFSEASEVHVEYTKIAFSYQNAALAGYIPALSKPTEGTTVALFVVSALLSIWLFASKKLPEALNNVNLTQSPHFVPRNLINAENAPTDFIEILTLVQGINAVVKQTEPWLRGKITDVILLPPPEHDLPQNPPDIEHSFNLLGARIEQSFAHPIIDPMANHRYELYHERLHELRRVSRARTVLEWDQFIFSWPVTADSPYIELIRQRDAIALALFIHWAACFRCLDHLWWAKGWSQKLVSDASPFLDNTWTEIIQWPRKEVGLDYQEIA